MGQRGPKPTLKLNAQKTRRVSAGIPARPVELTGDAAAEWDHIAAELDGAGLLAVTDRGILAAYCCAVSDMLAARDRLNKDGRWVEEPIQSSGGKELGVRLVDHPALKLLDRATARVQKLGHELGLSALARSRLDGAPQVDDAQTNKAVAIRERIQSARNGVG